MRDQNLANNAYQYLRDQFIAGAYTPGTRLLYGPIGKQIGISATPVREAAGRLANEGLLDLIPNKGAIVRSLDRQSLIDIYEVRSIIEPAAAALVAERADQEWIDKIRESLELMKSLAARATSISDEEGTNGKAFDAADHSFHVLTTQATGNATLVRTSTQSNTLTFVFGIRPHRNDHQTMTRTCDEHEQILVAIQDRDAAAAREAARRHIQSGLQSTLSNMDQQSDL